VLLGRSRVCQNSFQEILPPEDIKCLPLIIPIQKSHSYSQFTIPSEWNVVVHRGYITDHLLTITILLKFGKSYHRVDQELDHFTLHDQNRTQAGQCLQKLDAEALEVAHTHICGGSEMEHMTKAQRMQLILDKLETNRTFKHQQAEWERQARTGRNQLSVHDVCKTTFACSTLGSSAAMLTMVKGVKTLTQSVPVTLLDNQNKTQSGQGT